MPTVVSYGTRLTPREDEVIELICLGHGNAVIAESLGITYETVKRHVSHIFDKTGMDTRTEVASRRLIQKLEVAETTIADLRGEIEWMQRLLRVTGEI